MRSVLIVYPEADSPHAVRIVRPLARYLPELGWEPVLLTTPGAGTGFPLERIEVAAAELPRVRLGTPTEQAAGLTVFDARQFVATAKSALGRLLAIPDRYNWWGIKAARAAQRTTAFDAVLTSGPPHSAHFVGRSLARGGRRWVADMRDPWSTNAYTVYNRLAKMLDASVERRTLASASNITTVSEELAREVGRVHGRSIDVIENSFDENEFLDWPPPRLKPLTIVYTGNLIGGRRDPQPVFRAMRLLRERNPELPIRSFWVTDEPAFVEAAACAEGVGDVVESVPWRAREAVLALWREATVLVLLRWDHPYDTGVPTGKLYEYIGARRPVLSMGGAAGVVGRILRQSGTGYHAETPDEGAAFLERLASQSWNFDNEVPLSYTSRVMAERFARLLG